MRIVFISAIVLGAIVGGFLGLTNSGRQVLHRAGLTAACGGSDNC